MKKEYTDTLILKIPKEMKNKLMNKAQKEYKTISEYVRNLINEDLK